MLDRCIFRRTAARCLQEDIRPAGKRHMRKKTAEPDENRGFPESGFRRVRSGNASGIPATHEAAEAKLSFCRISCRSGRAVYPTEDIDAPKAEDAGEQLPLAISVYL